LLHTLRELGLKVLINVEKIATEKAHDIQDEIQEVE
jgi:hypothetical protein